MQGLKGVRGEGRGEGSARQMELGMNLMSVKSLLYERSWGVMVQGRSWGRQASTSGLNSALLTPSISSSAIVSASNSPAAGCQVSRVRLKQAKV